MGKRRRIEELELASAGLARALDELATKVAALELAHRLAVKPDPFCTCAPPPVPSPAVGAYEIWLRGVRGGARPL
jgi:hypothetical protein